jgi:hypothetical protein
MSSTIALVRHELGRWRAPWAVAAATLVLVLLAPLLPTLREYPTADVWSTTGLVSALVYGLGAGILMGVSVLGADLFRGGLGFYLSLPVSIRRFWSVRVGVAWATLVLTTSLVALPALATWPVVQRLDALGTASEVGYGWLFLAVLLVVPTVVLTLGHALGVGTRARTPWLGVDLLGLVVVGSVLAWGLVRLFGLGAPVEAVLAAGLFGVSALLALGVGGWRQIDGARTQVAILARLESFWTWGILGAGAVAVALASSWWLAVTPADLTRAEVHPAGPGMAYVMGEYRWRPSYRPVLVLREDGERFLNIRASWGFRMRGWGIVQAFSDDGTVGLLDGHEEPLLLRVQDEGIEIQPLAHLPSTRVMALDGNGDRLALALDRRVVLAEGPGWLPTGELKISSSLPAEEVRIDGDRLVWTGGRGTGRREIRVFDLRSGEALASFVVPLEDAGYFALGPRGRLAAVPRMGTSGWSLEIWDMVAGIPIETVSGTGLPHWGFTREGDFVAVIPAGPGFPDAIRRALVYRAAGGLVLDRALPSGPRWVLAGSHADGRPILLSSSGEAGGGTRLAALDPVTGEMEELAEVEPSLLPVTSWSWELPSMGIWLEEVGTGHYWRFDPGRGSLEPVLPKG